MFMCFDAAAGARILHIASVCVWVGGREENVDCYLSFADADDDNEDVCMRTSKKMDGGGWIESSCFYNVERVFYFVVEEPSDEFFRDFSWNFQ
jgi:hypothetical protein